MRPHDDRVFISSLLASPRRQLEYRLTCSRTENHGLTADLYPQAHPILDVNDPLTDAAMPSRKNECDMTVRELVTEIMNLRDENRQLYIVHTVQTRVDAQSCGFIRSDVYYCAFSVVVGLVGLGVVMLLVGHKAMTTEVAAQVVVG